MTDTNRFRYSIDLEVQDGFDPAEVSNQFSLDVIRLVQDTRGLIDLGNTRVAELK